MKIIICLMLLGICYSAGAQDEYIPAFPELPKKYREQKVEPYRLIQPPAIPEIRAVVEKPEVSNGRNTVVILPQDGMPCVIPAPQHYQMPNALVRKLRQSPADPAEIPNPAPPLKFRKN